MSEEDSNFFISDKKVLFYNSWQFKIFFSLEDANNYSKRKSLDSKKYYLKQIEICKEALKGLENS